MSTIDQQFVEFIVKSLVNKPEHVTVVRRIDEKGVLLELTVHPDDLGRIIGKRGATAQSLRSLMRTLGIKNDARYNLKIVDNDIAQTATSVQSDGSGKPVDVFTDEAVEEDNDVAIRTRKELAELDDLDI